MTQADFDAFNTAGGGLLAAWDVESGHHVEFLQIGDVNHDTEVSCLPLLAPTNCTRYRAGQWAATATS